MKAIFRIPKQGINAIFRVPKDGIKAVFKIEKLVSAENMVSKEEFETYKNEIILRFDEQGNLISAITSDIDTLSQEIELNHNQISVLSDTIIDNKEQFEKAIDNIVGDVENLQEIKADKSNIYSKTEIDEKINSLEIDTETLNQKIEANTLNITSLNNTKANQTDLDLTNNNLDALTGDVENLAGEMDNKQPIGDYATNSRVNEVENKIPSVSGLVTQSQLTVGLATKQNIINDLDTIREGASKGETALQEIPDSYALKTDIPDVSNFATNTRVNEVENKIPSLTGYATETYVQGYHDSTKQDIISDLDSIRLGASKGATSIQNTNDCLHLTGNETVTGIKTFNGGKGGNDVGIKSLTGMSIGSISTTAYTQYATIRNCNNQVNTGSYYINSNGAVLFRHKTGTALAEGTANDATFQIHPVNGITAEWSGKAGTAVATEGNVLVTEYNVIKGIATSVANSDGGEITLPKSFSNTNYVVIVTPRAIGNYFVSSQITATNKFKVRISDYYGNPVAVSFSYIALEN